MSDKVVTIGGKDLPSSKKSSEDCVVMLENWLERAKSGEVVSIAIAGTCADGGGIYGISQYVDSMSSLVGMLEVAKHQIITGGE